MKDLELRDLLADEDYANLEISSDNEKEIATEIWDMIAEGVADNNLLGIQVQYYYALVMYYNVNRYQGIISDPGNTGLEILSYIRKRQYETLNTLIKILVNLGILHPSWQGIESHSLITILFTHPHWGHTDIMVEVGSWITRHYINNR